MKKVSLSVALLVGLFSANMAFAACQKTLMGNDCEMQASGTSAHMRGNAVENAKAAKELKEAKVKAQKNAKEIAKATKK